MEKRETKQSYYVKKNMQLLPFNIPSGTPDLEAFVKLLVGV